MPGPRFSVVITCHNQAAFISAAVDSALSQNRELLREVIVVDDASSDGSQNLLQAYRESIRFQQLPVNRGAVEARNAGAALAEGEYLVFLDGDDFLKPWALDTYERLVAARKPTVVLGQMTWFSGEAPAARADDWPREVAFVEYERFIEKDRPVGFSASTYVVERETFWGVGGWTPGIFQLDLQDLSLKLARFRMILINTPTTAFYRIHGANSISTVPPFLRNLGKILEKERAGEYGARNEGRFVRHGWLGGLIVFWIKRSLRAGLYAEAIRLTISGSPLIAAAILQRAAAWMKGRQPVQTLVLDCRRAIS